MWMLRATMSRRKFLYSDFLRVANIYPNNVALCINQKKYTYKVIEEKARIWAYWLLKTACGLQYKSKRVGIFGYRSEASFVGVLAALFAGFTFVPLNPKFPIFRTKAMIQKSELDAIIVDASAFNQLHELIDADQIMTILLPENDIFMSNYMGKVITRTQLQEKQLIKQFPEPTNKVIYILFTSGSTGDPKMVPITHDNIAHFLEVNQNKYQINHTDRLSQTFDQTFDLSLFDIFMAWNNGACLYVIDPLSLLSPISFINENLITVWFSVPSVVNLLIKKNMLTSNSMLSLRISLFCGEALRKDCIEAWQAAASNSIIENLYGPTELTIACSSYRWDPNISPAECHNGIVPIGKLYENHYDLVVDENLEKTKYGEVGELCVAGPQVFSGYLNNEQETNKKFLVHDDKHGTKRCFYRTGDRVFFSKNGNYMYIGRIDHQIKVCGYRVELGEVESALCNIFGVSEAVAFGYPENNSLSYEGIVAFVVGNVNEASIFKTLRSLLPKYMVPKKIYFVESMPLNANGKIDRKKLSSKIADLNL